MALTDGTRLGPYQVTGLIGKGGMGEVYRARDGKLHRDVAIKVLPDLFAHDAERRARFEREAQVLAALNHPNIAAIYGLEESGGTFALVMELVEGPTLEERLKAQGSGLKAAHDSSGPKPSAMSPKPSGALDIDETLSIARQIADALEAAHEKGIIHRDLKPANVKVTPNGTVKVLDFGLAKALVDETSMADPSMSPTLTAGPTRLGVILGTAAYMSPEQAKGRTTDRRTDVWAFGCVLYEMLTGRRAFEGEDVSDTLAAVLRAEPDWSALPADLPAPVRNVVKRCLEKDRKKRIPDISVAQFLMNEAPVEMAPPVPIPATLPPPPPRKSTILWKAAASLLLLTTIAGAILAYLARSATPSVARFFVHAPEKTTFAINGQRATAVVISPDGRTLAFTARDATGKILLWVRAVDSLVAQPLAGTDDAASPFWSPDSRFLAYFTPGRVMKIGASGGPPQTLCTTNGNRGGAWNRDGVIVANGGPGQALIRVSSAGGQAVAAIPAVSGYSPVFPSFLPNGRQVLFYAVAGEQSGVYVGSLDTGQSKFLLAADSGAIYVPRNGYLLFARQGTLLAQSFDPKTLTFLDEPFPIAERVEASVIPGVVSFSASDSGVLAYGTGAGNAAGLQIVSIDRQGKMIGTVGPQEHYRGLDMSPDGKRVAAHRHLGQGGDIWITDLTRGTTTRFTFDASQDNYSPVWSPDGENILFASLRGGKWGIYQKPSNGAGNEERLVESEFNVLPLSWSPDGRSIVYQMFGSKTVNDLWMLPLSGDRKPVPMVQTQFNEFLAQVSPDGKWVAYMSNESGRNEVYARPFPSGAGKWQVSLNGGTVPRWRRDSRELFYMDPQSNGKMMTVEIMPGDATFQAGTPKELFEHAFLSAPHIGNYFNYAVSGDGQRFLIPRPASNITEQAVASPIAVVLNWDAAVKK